MGMPRPINNGDYEIQQIEFITIDDMTKPPKERKATVWCSTNSLRMYRDFMQYVLDNCNRPEEYMILDVKKGFVYDMYRMATEVYKMRKRTFEEKLKNVQTGIWSDDEEEVVA